MAQTVKCLPAMRETWVQFLGREDPLEKEMATHSSTLAWKIPWREEPGRLQSMGWGSLGQKAGEAWDPSPLSVTTSHRCLWSELEKPRSWLKAECPWAPFPFFFFFLFFFLIFVFNFCQFDYYVSWCNPPWVCPAWDSLYFLDLVDYFLSHVR